MKYEQLPKEIRAYLKENTFTENTVGLSKSTILDFGTMILKIEEQGYISNNEVTMLNWLQDKLPVPKVIVTISKDNLNYILMEKLPGVMSFDESLLDTPIELIKLLTKGIKLLRSVDIKDCPSINMLDKKIEVVTHRVKNNLCRYDQIDLDLFNQNRMSTFEEVLDYIIENKPIEFPVLTHGDYCLPNVFINKEHVSGFIDLGLAGVSDIWQDVALGLRSLKYNLGGRYKKEYEDIFLKELGLEMDIDKFNYYLLLDELF